MTKLNTYRIIERAVEEGISYGYKKAYKHDEAPDEEYIKDQILYAVMLELSEVMNFEDN